MDARVDRIAAHKSLAALLKALGHPARLEILRVLAERGTCICGEVVEVLPLAQSTVSQHLKVLKEAGLVRGEVEGPKSCYCLDPEIVTQFRISLDELFECLSGGCAP
jgi:ArsR family transcriptional regulator